MLTRKQYDLLLFINEYINSNGVSPSFDEMKDALNLKSKSGIYRLIGSLQERGFLAKLANRARALEVIRLPGNVDPDNLPKRNPRSDRKHRPEQDNLTQIGGYRDSQPFHSRQQLIQLPLYGIIAAGTPIEALRDESMMVEVPLTMLGKGDHYALEIDGDSMVEAGILNGDTVVIERAERVNNGDIAVALIDNEEATLKRYEQNGDMITLHPANRHYQTFQYSVERVSIQGKLVGLMRKY